MKRVICLLSLIALLLSGCVMSMTDAELVTVYYHNLQEVTVVLPDGTSDRRVYQYSKENSDLYLDYIRCVYYEDDLEVYAEDYVRDSLNNIVSISSDQGITTFTLTYDDAKRVIKRIKLHNGEETGYEEYMYSKEGLLTEIAEYSGGNLVLKTVTEYDESGRRTKVIRCDGTNTITSYDECKFDANKFTEIVSQFDGSGTLIGHLENSCDIHYNIVEEKAYDADGVLISTTRWSYQTGTIKYNINADDRDWDYYYGRIFS